MNKILIVTHNETSTTCKTLLQIAYGLEAVQITIISFKIENHDLMVNIPDNVQQIFENYNIILANNDVLSNIILAQIAVALNSNIIGNVIKFISATDVISERFTAKIHADVRNDNFHKLYSVSCAKLDQSGDALLEENNASPINYDKIEANLSQQNFSFLDCASISMEDHKLPTASCIVSGGIALKNSENFTQLIIALADKMHGEYAGTLLAAEQKLLPFHKHVGQTGYSVSPLLYLACGISGAPQHITGIHNAKTIIAINTDSTAQIFEYADYGITEDLFNVIPMLLRDL